MYEVDKFLNTVFRATLIPGIFVIIWLTGLISLATAQISLVAFLVIFVVFPLIFRYCITLQRGILFLTFIRYPKNLDLTRPETVGLYATRNFYLKVRDNDVENGPEGDGVKIGVWHVLPQHLAKRFEKELKIDASFTALQNASIDSNEPANNAHLNRMEPILKSEFPEVIPENEQLFYERMLKLPGTIVLYLHGNTASRGSGHRVDMYNVLRKLGYHVLSLDYRGYGDSDAISPSEEGVVRDAMAVYMYISNITSNPIIIWGHSLGTGVATNMCAQLNYMNERGPRGIILESPFTNIREEILRHPFAKPFKHLPWFDLTISRPMYSNSLRFESDQHISQFRQPLMILHSEDDYVVPFQLGYKLYRIALDARGKAWGPVEFHRFDGSRNYGHKFICNAPELPALVENFVNNYRYEIF